MVQGCEKVSDFGWAQFIKGTYTFTKWKSRKTVDGSVNPQIHRNFAIWDHYRTPDSLKLVLLSKWKKAHINVTGGAHIPSAPFKFCKISQDIFFT